MLATSQWILAKCVTSDLRTSSPRYRQVLAWLTTHSAERFGGLDMPSASGQCAPQEWRGGHQTANLVLDPRRPSLTESLTEDDSATGGPQDTRRTGSTRFWDVSSTDGPQTTGRTISGRLRIWRLGVRIPRGALLTSGFGAEAPVARLTWWAGVTAGVTFRVTPATVLPQVVMPTVGCPRPDTTSNPLLAMPTLGRQAGAAAVWHE
jgi:hypothetical protein